MTSPSLPAIAQVSADMLALGRTPAPKAHGVSYPLTLNRRATTGALLGPDGETRDQLLIELCRGVVGVGGMVWCAEPWPEAAPAEVRELADTTFVATRTDPTRRDGVDLADEFSGVEGLITFRRDQAAAISERPARQSPVLVMLSEADAILGECPRVAHDHVAGQLLQLIRKGAQHGIGFLIVTSEIDGIVRRMGDRPIDGGACLVLGNASPDVHARLKLRHRLSIRTTPRAGIAYLVHGGEAYPFDLPTASPRPTQGALE